MLAVRHRNLSPNGAECNSLGQRPRIMIVRYHTIIRALKGRNVF